LRPNLFYVPIIALLGGCAVQVFHPNRTRAEQERDIQICDDQGYYSSPYDPLLAYQLALDCLEAKGYQPRKAKAERSIPARQSPEIQVLRMGETCGIGPPRPMAAPW
jgi:hypothetical protein